MAKRITAVITASGEERTISVLLDDETAKVLESVADKQIVDRYIIDEYKASLIDRRETRRHTTLENSLYVIDEKADMDFCIAKRELYSALKLLTDKQREVFISHTLEKKSFRAIGDEMGIHKQTVLEMYNAAIKKLKNFLE